MVAAAGHTRSRCDLNTDPRMMEFFDSKLFPSHEKRSQRQLLESPKTTKTPQYTRCGIMSSFVLSIVYFLSISMHFKRWMMGYI